jgi:hypothetical protein
MRFDGRIEKRDPIKVPLYIETLAERRAAEKTVAADVSSHGAQVVTNRPWKPGERILVVPLSGEFELSARVVYCRALANGSFCVGLQFGGQPVDWGKWPRA